jgi:type IV fimbrial biogenesis protein FimT
MYAICDRPYAPPSRLSDAPAHVTQYRSVRAPSPVHFRAMKRQTGFNITELMVVLAIVAILLAIGVPSFRYVTNANRASSEVNGLLGDLMYARAEAIREGTPVVVCTSADAQSCANVTTWEGGWIICVANAGGTCDATTAVLHKQNTFATAFNSTDTLRPDATSNASAVSFNRMGFAIGLNAAGATFTLHDATASSQWTRCLSVTVVGMLTVTNHVQTPGCI